MDLVRPDHVLISLKDSGRKPELPERPIAVTLQEDVFYQSRQTFTRSGKNCEPYFR